jgi:hypothetical protein
MTGEMTQETRERIARLLRGIRLRAGLIVVLVALPLGLTATSLAYRFSGMPIAASVAIAFVAMALALAWRRSRFFDPAWLARRLDASLPQLEDSADLLVTSRAPDDASARTGLQRLQLARLYARLAGLTLPELRPAYPHRWLLGCWIGGLLASVVIAYAPALLSRAPHPAPQEESTRTDTITKVLDVAIESTPPPYTGLARESFSELDAKVPVGSRLGWTLTLRPQPSAAMLAFLDGTQVPLHLDGNVWRAERTIDKSTLYRLVLDGPPLAGGDHLNRIDAVPDHAPEITVRAPEKTLNVLTQGIKSWDLAFDARDDYGLRAAELSIQLAQGSGEQIAVTEQKLVLDGRGDAHERSYRKSLDLAALGFAPGDDLIVRLSVADNREPEPNRTSSASFILRWQLEASSETAGMEGLVQKVMPAYFRSQRQIIIDTEALLGERDGLEEKRFAARSDDLGLDQRTLRLRYGQFLGEESEGGELVHEHESAGEVTEPEREIRGFGEEGEIVEQYGHVHDLPDAATMLDQPTQEILRAALREMWHAELHLRQAHPDLALPFEYKALDYIKQVQQAERIYLARVGVELPHVDEARRLSGDRTGLKDRASTLPPSDQGDSPIRAAWQALATGAPIDLTQLDAWTRLHRDTVPDALDLFEAIDGLRRDPDCLSCRRALQARLWPLLPAAATSVIPRAIPDAAGAAYLEALSANPP